MADTNPRIGQVEQSLKARYFSIVPELPGNQTDHDKERNRLSRCLAAFAVEKLASVSPVDAAASITDGGNDNGVDAVYFDESANRLILVQAKIGGAADMGENKKFCDGIRDLIHRRWTKFNASFVRLQLRIESALNSDGLVIVGCQVHLGATLGTHAISDLQQLADELNEFFQRFEWRDDGIATVHGWLAAEHAQQIPTVSLTLEKWHGSAGPPRTFYGQVAASVLASLHHEHGKMLFDRNIRDFLGVSGVNAAIAKTAGDEPHELFYLNNGLTGVCTSISAPAGATHESATFTLHGFSIVNGAQTVGSLAHATGDGGTLSADAKVMMTLIEVGPTGGDLGTRITRARNTQNAIRGLHFAALDPQQERLRQELAVSGIAYHYRPSEPASASGPGSFTLETAALALACLSGDTPIIVAAKKEVGQLHDASGAIYPRLFTGTLSGVQLCRRVRIYEYMSEVIQNAEATETGLRTAFFRHGRYFVMHIVARKHRALIEKPELDLSNEDKLALSRLALDMTELVWDVAQRQAYQKGYLSVFRNQTDAEPLARAVMREIAERDKAANATIPTAQVPSPATTPAVAGTVASQADDGDGAAPPPEESGRAPESEQTDGEQGHAS